MGATLPALERCLAPLTAGGRCVGALNAANTLGAAVGILGTTFVLAPALGLRSCAWLLSAICVLCGVAALRLRAPRSSSATVDERQPRRDLPRPTAGRSAPAENPRAPRGPGAVSRLRLSVTVFFTGLLGIGFETVGVRVLSQVLENTVYTFAAVLLPSFGSDRSHH